MKAIIIGAGRGIRLMPTTADTPKCFAEIGNRRILDWIIQAFADNGIHDICFIGGYQIDKVRQAYPGFLFRHNVDWPNNNILASLMYAEDQMDGPFICCYADILFTAEVVRRLLASPADIALGVDTQWLDRYTHRTEHPPDDAEKVTVADGAITRIHRGIDPAEAHGEYIGVAKFSAAGAAALREHYHRCRRQYAGQPFREARVFEKAYLIHLLQDMIEAGAPMVHVDTPGGYMEIDTQQDFEVRPPFVEVIMAVPRMFPTTVVGSMPRPQFVRDLLRPGTRQTLGDAEFTRRLDIAVAYVIAMQESAGIDIISDGEWRRLSYIGVIADICDGFEVGYQGQQPWTIVVGKIAPRAPGLVAREACFVRDHSRCEPKVALPSPYLLGQRMWDPSKSAGAYATREAFMRALVPVLRGELEAIRAAGLKRVQFDDPHLCLFVDERVRQQFADPVRELDLGVELLNEILAGFEDLDTAIDLCRRNKARQGWVGEGGYGPILDHLGRLRVKQYMLEFAIPAAGDYAVLRDLPADRGIGLGCVDCRGEHIDAPEEIAARVEKALQFVSANRITLHPDCGFAPGSAADIPIDEAYRKLCNEALAAEMLRQRFG